MELEQYERLLLLDILQHYLDGADDTREDMMDDVSTLNEFDMFTKTLQQHDIDVRTVESIKRKVVDDA